MNTILGTIPVVGIHQEEHPEYVEGCDHCRWSSVSVAPSATPTRKGGAEAARINAGDKQLAKDRDAYKELRKQGYQPRNVDGCADLATRAVDRFDIERGHTVTDPAMKKEVIEGEKIVRDMGLIGG